MPEKVLFKTGRIHGFSNRNAADDAEAVWRSHKKKSAKNYSLDRQTTSSQIGEITGVKRNCFSNILPFSPNIVFLSLPRNLTAALFCLPPSGRSWQNHIPFGRSFSFQGASGRSLCHLSFLSAFRLLECSTKPSARISFNIQSMLIPIFAMLVLFLVVGQSGLEPPTSRLSVVRSSQLSYGPVLAAFPLRVPSKLNNVTSI